MTPEDRLRTELQALESSVPVALQAHLSPARGRARTWPAVAVIGVLVASTAIGVGAAALLRRPRSDSSTNGGAVTAEVREGDFVLRITAPRSKWATDEPIAVAATLTYDGPLQEIELGATRSGPIAFSVVEQNGPRAMRAGWEQDCASHHLTRSEPLLKPYSKSGGWSDSDPNAAFYQEFFADPEFRLPAGRWEVSAETLFSVGECSAETVEMRATIVLDVKLSVAEESASSTASDEPSPSPVLVAVPTDALFPGGTPGPCPAALIAGTLVRDTETGLALHLDEGLRVAVTWPFGYVARDGTSGLELLDADGEVVAHEGDRVALGGGELRGGQAWRACTGVDQIIKPSKSATPGSSGS